MRPSGLNRETLLKYGLIALRARWFGLGAGLVLVALAWQRGWIASSASSLAGLLAFVGLYNAVIHVLIRRWDRRGVLPSLGTIHVVRRVSSVLDVGAFLVAIHLTGGVQSPLFSFFLLGFVLLGIASTGPEIVTYGLLTMVVLPVVATLEAQGIVRHHPVGSYMADELYRRPEFVAGTIFYWAILFGAGIGLVWLIRGVLLEREARLEERGRELAQQRRFHAEVIHHLPVGVAVFNRGGAITFSNPMVEDLLGLDLIDHRNLLRQEALEASGLTVYVDRLLDGQPLELVDFPYVAAGAAAKRWLRIIGVPPTGRQQGILMVEDTTEAKRRDEQERQLQERLSQADKFTSLGQMASGVAHELNNPLTAILGTAQYMDYVVRQGKLTPDLVREKSEHIVTHSKRIEELIKGLLTYSKPGRDQAQSVDVAKMIDELLSFSAYELKRGGVQLDCEVASGLPPFLGSKTELQQLILNLLTNARHAVDRKTGRIGLTVERSVQDGEPMLTIAVRDNGPGIDPEVVDRIFEPFFTTKGPDHGTGLGLAIVNAIVERYEGAIGIETEPGDGTVFQVRLPYLDELPDWEPQGEQTFSPYG